MKWSFTKISGKTDGACSRQLKLYRPPGVCIFTGQRAGLFLLVAPDRQFTAVGIRKMKPPPSGEGKYRLAESASGGSDAFRRGFRIFKHRQRSALTAVRTQRGVAESAVHTAVIKGAVAVAAILEGPAKHASVKRPGLSEVFRRQIDITDSGVFFHDRTSPGPRPLP